MVVSILLTSIFPLQSITMKRWEIESGVDKVKEEYLLGSTEEMFSDRKHSEGKP